MYQTINQEKLNATLRFLNKMGETNLDQQKSIDPAAAERLEKLGKLLNDEDFCKQFILCSDQQTAVTLFAQHGLALTVEEVEALATQLKAIARKLVENDGILSEEELEQIAGGMSTNTAIGCGVVGSAVGGAGIGTLICPGIGSLIGALIGAIASGILLGI